MHLGITYIQAYMHQDMDKINSHAHASRKSNSTLTLSCQVQLSLTNSDYDGAESIPFSPNLTMSHGVLQASKQGQGVCVYMHARTPQANHDQVSDPVDSASTRLRSATANMASPSYSWLLRLLGC
jgi:hypothetical protein